MGLFDSFMSPNEDLCPSGHNLAEQHSDKKETEYQTKTLECMMNRYRYGDKIITSYGRYDDEELDLVIRHGKIWVYTWCSQCDKLMGRWAHILNNIFTGLSNEMWIENWDEDERKYVREGPFLVKVAE